MAKVGTEKLTRPQAAARAGVKPDTWGGYVSRGYAPEPDGRHDRRTPWWWDTTVDEWKRDRKGQGARTDLAEQPKRDTEATRRSGGRGGRAATPADGVAPPTKTTSRKQ